MAEGYGPAWRDNVLQEALDKLEADPQDFLGWFAIAALFRDLAIEGEAEEKLAIAIGRLDLVAVAEKDRASDIHVLPLLAGRLAHFRNAAVRQHITQELVRLADWYGLNNGTEDEASRVVSLTVAHSYPVAAKNTSVAEFEATCLRVVHGFPNAAQSMRDYVSTLCKELSTEDAAAFWPLLLKLRAVS
jgi:hypothetical protein